MLQSLAMRVLLLSDIHANLVALEAVLRRTPAYDAVWCLGDVVGYGPAPNECVARLRGLGALTLAGNHDVAAIGNAPLEVFRSGARLALEWTRRVLTPESKAWLAALEPKRILPEHHLTLVHASPRDALWEYIENEHVASENFPHFETDMAFFGHTHQPIAYRLRETEKILRTAILPESKPLPLEPKLLLNPGSVGQPRDGDPRAAFALFDTETQFITPYRMEYDIAAVQRAMANANLPHRLIARLAQGA